MLDKLANGIPLAEAADYFIRLRDFEKKADIADVGSSTYEPPDETGQLEGMFTAPVEQVIAHMAKMVQNELKTNYAYMVYANSLRDLAHISIAEEFEDHAHDETEHADWLLRRMSVLGGPVSVPDIPAPPASSDPHGIIQTMVRMEQEGIQNWRILRQMVGDENPTKFKIEEYLTQEQEHLDELWQLQPHTESTPVLATRAGQSMAEVAAPPPPPSAPDTATTPETSGSKTAAARPERFSDWMLYAKMKWAAAKMADAMGAPPLPDTAMGKQTAAPPPAPLAGAAAGQVAKIASRFTAKLAELHLDKTLAPNGIRSALRNVGVGLSKKNLLMGAMAHHVPMDAIESIDRAARAGGVAGSKNMNAAFGEQAKSLFKRAAEELLPNAGASMPPQPAEPTQEGLQPPAPPQHSPETMAYLQQEQEGMAAEHEQEQAFYKQKFEQAAQELQAAQQQMQASQEQQMQLQQQVDQSGEAQQAALAQAQQVQQAAMANAGAAHVAATQAMQQSLSAQKETIDQQQLSVGMRDAVHAMRQSLMQQIQQQLPPATTAESNAMAVDQAQADQQAQQQAAMGGQPAAPGQDPQQPGAPSAPAGNTAGQPAAAPDAGTPPDAATPGATGPGVSPNNGPGTPSPAEGAAPQGQATQQEQPKTASPHDRFVGALMGGAVGGVGTAIENGMSNDPLRAKVQNLEERERGGGGFLNAMQLAQAKSRLALAEFGENHPVASAAIGTGIGALAGSRMAPALRQMVGG